jgi:hypothetical protein
MLLLVGVFNLRKSGVNSVYGLLRLGLVRHIVPMSNQYLVEKLNFLRLD